MEIKQIVIGANGMIYGLNTDNKVYRWDYSGATWLPYFKETKTETAPEKPPIAGGGIPLVV